MKRYALVLLLAACGGDEETKSDTSTTDTQDPFDSSEPSASTLTGVSAPANPQPEPTPNEGCAGAGNQVYAGTNGFRYPWQGASAGGDPFTCDGCKTGDEDLQGSWRVHGFVDETEDADPDYAFPDPETDYAETLKVDGNTFEIHIRDAKAASGQQDSVFRGWYFCSQKPENDHEHLFWVITEVDAGSDAVGDVIESDVILGQTPNILTYWYRSVGGTEYDQGAYCKIGTTNPANAAQTCTDPFAQ